MNTMQGQSVPAPDYSPDDVHQARLELLSRAKNAQAAVELLMSRREDLDREIAGYSTLSDMCSHAVEMYDSRYPQEAPVYTNEALKTL